MASVPIWAFTGDADDVINPAGTTDTATALQSCPAPPRQDIRLTVYPEAQHNSWTETYDNQKVYDWLLSHRLPHAPQ